MQSLSYFATNCICSFFLSGAAIAASIPIVNASFEDPGTNVDGTGIVPGWMRSDLSDKDASGIWRPESFNFSLIPDGGQVAYVRTGSGYISQSLAATLTADTSYALSAFVGRYQGAQAPAYAVELLAGGSLLAQSSSPIPAGGQFIESIVEFTATAGDLRIGQGLEIRLYSTEPMRYPENWAHFDDVQLTAVLNILGDFNADGILSAADIDLLSSEIGVATGDLTFDINGDGLVDLEDHQHWVENSSFANTFIGDADLNRTVEFGDFLALSASFGQDGGWAMGDFDGNGEVGFPDFLALSANFGNSNASVASVPEPSSSVLLLLLSSMALLPRYRRCDP